MEISVIKLLRFSSVLGRFISLPALFEMSSPTQLIRRVENGCQPLIYMLPAMYVMNIS